jgi:hypothetical protein
MNNLFYYKTLPICEGNIKVFAINTLKGNYLTDKSKKKNN